MEQVFGPGNGVLPTWLVTADSELRKDIELILLSAPPLRFERSFSRWQAALEEMRALQQPVQAQQTHIVLIDDRQEPGSLSWLAALKDVSRVLVIALLRNPSDLYLATAFQAGVSGFILMPCSPEQISSAAMSAVSGEITVSPAIMRSMARIGGKMRGEKKSYGLTAREKEVLSLLAEGHLVKELAQRLCISYHTADAHVKSIHRKLSAKNSRSVISIAIREHILDRIG